MGGWRVLLTPGDSLARRFDGGYAKFTTRMKREMGKGNRRLAIYSLLARAECGLAFVVGASASYFGFVIVVPLVLCFYPLIALGDPFMWHRTYGRLARGVGYKASFLLNLDMLYWFAIYALLGSKVHGVTFACYDPQTGTWAIKSTPPSGIDDRASLAWAGDKYIYALQGEYIGCCTFLPACQKIQFTKSLRGKKGSKLALLIFPESWIESGLFPYIFLINASKNPLLSSSLRELGGTKCFMILSQACPEKSLNNFPIKAFKNLFLSLGFREFNAANFVLF